MSAAPIRGSIQAPIWILRHHAPSPIHALRLITLHDERSSPAHAQTFVLAGDAQGRISLTALKDLRPRYFWQAHEQSILGLDIVQLDRQTCVMLSQGRDHKAHTFRLLATQTVSLNVLPSRIQQDLPVPELLFTLEINALNYCPISVMSKSDGALVAVPHTLDSGYVDVLRLATKERIARAVGKADIQSSDSRASQRAPMCMTMHLMPANDKGQLFRLLAGYEDGYVRLWSVEKGGTGVLVWSERKHTESVMSSCLSHDASVAVSVAADDRIVRYELAKGKQVHSVTCRSTGNASVVLREDDARIAVGGWDGAVRLYDDNLEHLASLRYHKDTVQALSFVERREVHLAAETDLEEMDSDEDDANINAAGLRSVEDLLVTGGKEGRICLWRIA